MSGRVEPISPLKLAAKNLKLTSPRCEYPYTDINHSDQTCFSLPGYLVTPEEVDHYTNELWGALRDGIFKIRVAGQYPFTADGVREAQRELTTPGGKLAGKILIKISDE